MKDYHKKFMFFDKNFDNSHFDKKRAQITKRKNS